MSNEEQNYDDLCVGQIWRNSEGNLLIIRDFPTEDTVSYDIHHSQPAAIDAPARGIVTIKSSFVYNLRTYNAEPIYEPPAPKRELKVGQVWQYADSREYRVIAQIRLNFDGVRIVHSANVAGGYVINDSHTEDGLQRVLEENRAYLASS